VSAAEVVAIGCEAWRVLRKAQRAGASTAWGRQGPALAERAPISWGETTPSSKRSIGTCSIRLQRAVGRSAGGRNGPWKPTPPSPAQPTGALTESDPPASAPAPGFPRRQTLSGTCLCSRREPLRSRVDPSVPTPSNSLMGGRREPGLAHRCLPGLRPPARHSRSWPKRPQHTALQGQRFGEGTASRQPQGSGWPR